MAYNNRGGTYMETGRAKRAIDDYTEAVRLNPQLGEAFYNRATVFAVLGNMVVAKKGLEQAETLGVALPNYVP